MCSFVKLIILTINTLSNRRFTISHVTQIKYRILDLDALEAACNRPGSTLEFRRDKKNYNWWGSSVGDYNDGTIRSKDLNGKCSHAIAVKGSPWLDTADRSKPYEVGVCQEEDGSFSLRMDFYAGGHGLVKAVGGNKCEGLIHGYLIEVQKKTLEQTLEGQGWSIIEVPQANGDTQVQAVRGVAGF